MAVVRSPIPNLGCLTRSLASLCILLNQLANSTSLEHVRILLEGPVDILESTIRNYRTCLCVVSDTTPIVPQTSKAPSGQPLTTLTPNYLCLQCSATTTVSGRIEHGMETKHRFCMCHCIAGPVVADTDFLRCRVQKWLPLLPDVQRFCI